MKCTVPLILATALCLSACGNKGPLVMPQKPVPVETSTDAPATTTTPEATPAEPAEMPAETPADPPAENSAPPTESAPKLDPK